MAQKVQVLVTSDLSGGAGAQTVKFGFEGYEYEIDLTETEQEEFARFLSPYVGAARRTGGKRTGGRRGGRGSASSSSPNTAVIREWAKSQGLEVNERGRIPADIVRKYEEAHA